MHLAKDIIKLLIDEGVDLDIQNDEGVLHNSVLYFLDEIVTSIAGADPEIVNSLDLTAMDLVSVEWDGTRE